MPISPVATDNFNAYANGTKLAAAANWDAAVGTGAFICRTTTVIEVDPAFNAIGADYWAGAGSFTDAQYSQIVCSSGGTGDSYGGPAVQVKAADDDWFHLVGNGVDAGGPYLEEVDGGVITTLTAFAIDGWDTADEIRLEYDASGVLHAILNEVELGTDTPSFALTGGKPGLGVGFEDGANPKYDTWEGGNVTAGGSAQTASASDSAVASDSPTARAQFKPSASDSAVATEDITLTVTSSTPDEIALASDAATAQAAYVATRSDTALASDTVSAAGVGSQTGSATDNALASDTAAAAMAAERAAQDSALASDSAAVVQAIEALLADIARAADTPTVAAAVGVGVGDTALAEDSADAFVGDRNPSQTHTAAARTFTSTAGARPRVWTAPGRD